MELGVILKFSEPTGDFVPKFPSPGLQVGIWPPKTAQIDSMSTLERHQGILLPIIFHKL